MSEGNGVFKSAFENDIIIKEQSKIALLNLTFKTDVDALTLNRNNNLVQTRSDQNNINTLGISRMEPITYRRSNLLDLSNDLMDTLNNTLTIPAAPTGTEENNISSMFAVYGRGSVVEGPFQIQQRYCPFINPLSGGRGVPDYPTEPSAQTAGEVDVDNTGGAMDLVHVISKENGTIASIDTLNRVESITEHYFSRGSGLITLRINDSVTNASGLQDNGGCLGITNSDSFGLDQEIPLDSMVIQLRYNRPTETYKYIINGAAEVDSGIMPAQVALLAHADVADHDVLFIQKNGPNYEFGVFQMYEGGYINLTTGNIWTQAPAPATENFDETNLGNIAKYRRVQVGVPGFEQWWEPTSPTEWNIYNTKPVAGSIVDATAIIDVGTGVLTIGGGPTTFTPAQLPTVVAVAPTKQVFGTLPAVYQGSGVDNRFVQPYMTLRGAKDDIKFDSYNYSIDPWIDVPPGTPNAPNENWAIIPNNGISGWDNGYRDSLAGNLGSVITEIYSEPNNGRYGQTYSTSISMHGDIWQTLGFVQVPDRDEYEIEYEALGPTASSGPLASTATWTAAKEGQLVSSDNYIVISDTLTLDSYDASQFEYGNFDDNSLAGGERRGRRKNILMTIPVNDNTNGLVEFQTNTPVFININNAKNNNVRNLNFRILKKDFTPIYSRQATMTILIED